MHNSILARRKELKKKGHSVVRSHYFLLVFLMLIMTLFGTEFRGAVSRWGKNPLAEEEADDVQNDPGNVLSDAKIFSGSDVISDISLGKLAEGSERAEENSLALKDRFSDSKALGLTNGVLAQIVNSLLSGQLFVHLAQTIRTVTRSDKATAVLFTIGAFLWYALGFILLKNVYSAVIRRAYLTARTYRVVSMSDITWFAVVRKWISACLTMLVVNIYGVLWGLTLVGAVIKYYAYWAVPWIVAENPSLSPNQAISLSRRMMNGHKWELFKYQVTFLGWSGLSLVTSGISDLVYGNAYRLAAETEFYVLLREEMLAREPETAQMLHDACLFQPADRITLAETYFDVVEEITDIHEKKIDMGGWRHVIADWFGIWLYKTSQKRVYDEQEERGLALRHDKLSLQGQAYPRRLSPLWKNRKETRPEQYSYIRHYTVWTLIILFMLFCFVGWSWEVALHFMQTGQFVNRGTLHGPWLPIYGTGGLIVLILCSRFRKNPFVEFLTAVVLCGTLEYVSAWHLENKYHQRWWSYDGYFLNLHGRICAEGLLVFGVGCCVVVYLVAPAVDHLLSKVKQKGLIILCLILTTAYTSDLLYSREHPNMAEGAIEQQDTAKVRQVFQ